MLWYWQLQILSVHCSPRFLRHTRFLKLAVSSNWEEWMGEFGKKHNHDHHLHRVAWKNEWCGSHSVVLHQPISWKEMSQIWMSSSTKQIISRGNSLYDDYVCGSLRNYAYVKAASTVIGHGWCQTGTCPKLGSLQPGNSPSWTAKSSHKYGFEKWRFWFSLIDL